MELSGAELDEYCKNRGLCNRCAKVVTHKRVVKIYGQKSNWEPLTILKENPKTSNNHDTFSGITGISNPEYSVYKGYCLKDHTCYTMSEAKKLLGESKSKRKLFKRPGRRRMRTNPETGSVSGESIASGMSALSGVSQGSTASRSSWTSGLSRVSGRFRSGKNNKKKKEGGSSFDSWSVHSFNPNDNGSSLPNTDAGSAILSPTSDSTVSPIVTSLVEQLINHDYFVVLDLCRVDLSTAKGSANIDAIVHALRNTQTLESITLKHCSLDDEGIEKLAGGLEDHFNTTHEGGDSLKKLQLKGNKIGNRGVQALEFLFRSSSTLEELDLSTNRIGSKGAASILESLAQNKVGIPLSVLNLSQNEIWDLSGNVHYTSRATKQKTNSHTRSYSFLHTNTTLLELNLDGNCLHDEGAEFISDALRLNNHNCMLNKLYLGYNGIGDSGATALAKALESNSSIQVLGLAENDITNTGARALLSALAVNVSMKEISGLYHNRIDRKFIIVAIKRLLHRGGNDESRGDGKGDDLNQERFRNNDPTLMIDGVGTAEETYDTESTTFSSSTSSEVVLQPVNPSQQKNRNLDNTVSISTPNGSLALEAIESWDWGTFGIEEIEQKSAAETESQIDNLLKEIEEELSQDGDNPLVDESCKSGVTAVDASSKGDSKKKFADRLVVFQSAPLAYFDRKTMQHHGVPLLDFGCEADALRQVFGDDNGKGAVEVVFETATQNNFSNAFAKSWSPVLHFSCYGNSDCIALENGFGYMQALPLDALKKTVAAATATTSSQVEVVVISSCHAEHLAEEFLNAGVPRVVVLPRDTTAFGDEGPIDFAKAFYAALQQSKSLKEAFDAGIEECSKNQPSLLDSYKLLPEGANHDVEIFFQSPPPPMARAIIPTDIIRDDDPMAILPKVPDQFFGREVDIYEILESLRVDDVIRIGGAKGSGKKSLLSVLSRYILDRSKSFQIDSIFWLPRPVGIIPKAHSLYRDLCQVIQWIMAAEDDIWDDEDYKGARERILIEMESRNSILVIDGRAFTNEIAGEMLERFLTHLLNELNVKIILITANNTPRAKTKRSSSEESTVYLRPLDFRSTVKLYANACPLITSADENDSNIDTVGEFESYLLPGCTAMKEKGGSAPPVVDANLPDRSRRQSELYQIMGGGIPEDVVRTATSCTPDVLSELLKIAQRPELSVTTSKELEEQLEKWTAVRDHAIHSKYYMRANDIEKTLEELKDLKKVYPSMEEMKAKEADLKKTFSVLLKAKRYDDANVLKRKILLLKRSMMKEKNSLLSPTDNRKADALDSINELQERMKRMMTLAEKLDSSYTSFTETEDCDMLAETSFFVSKGCTLEISCGNLASFWKESSKKTTAAMVVWTNEACDLPGNEEVMKEVLGDTVNEKLASINIHANTQWGPVKCASGDTVAVNTNDGCIVLAVPPLMLKQPASKKEDNEHVWYTEKMLSNAIRSSFRKIRRSNSEDLVIGISTISDDACREDVNEIKDHSLNRNLAVTLHSVVKELRGANYAGGVNAKTIVRLFASSGPDEALELIRIATEHGLTAV